MPEPPGISPYRLLVDAERSAEVLVLSFVAELGFFERFALGAARATQARVTTISDATAVSADPAVVRGAGRTYLDARAACPGGTAFHPKLLVIAGADRATVAVGSGNLTLSGWHHNAELWSAMHADAEQGPQALRSLARFLRALAPAGVHLTHGASEALERVAGLLDGLPADAPGPLVVSSAFGPVIDQLPTGPVDELLVYAPFVDARLAALERLAQRFDPAQLTICVQPRMTVVDGERLARFAADRGAAVMEVDEDRYRHGKLVEWRIGDRRFALTGSANLSAAALLLPLGAGGNCELGLVTETGASLRPPLGGALEPGQIAAAGGRAIEHERPAVVVLGAIATDGGLRLQLVSSLAADGALQAYADGVWADRAAVPAASAEALIAPPEGGWQVGAPLRVRTDAGAVSNVVFVADLGRVLRTSRPHVGGTLVVDDDALFSDASLLDGFLADAQLLRPHLLLTAGRGGDAAGDGDDRARAVERLRSQSLEEYLDVCASVLGEPMLRFALGLPALPGGAARALDAFEGLEDDESGEEGAGPDAAAPAAIFGATSAVRRRRYQTWCVRLADLAPALVPVGRVLAVRLIARAAAGELWADREEWTPLLARVLAGLDGPGPWHAEERAAAASMGAVGLAILHSQIRSFSHSDPVRSLFDASAAALTPLLGDVAAERVAEYGDELAVAFGPGVTPAGVEPLLHELAHPPDPLDRAVDLLAREHEMPARRRGPVIAYDEELEGDPRWRLLLALGLAEPAAPVAAMGHAPRGRVMAIWQPPHVVLLHEAPKGVWGGVHRVADDLTPRLHAVNREELPAPLVRWSVAEPMPDVAAGAVAALGLPVERPFDGDAAQSD